MWGELVAAAASSEPLVNPCQSSWIPERGVPEGGLTVQLLPSVAHSRHLGSIEHYCVLLSTWGCKSLTRARCRWVLPWDLGWGDWGLAVWPVLAQGRSKNRDCPGCVRRKA